MAFTDPAKNLESLGLHEGMIVADFGAGSGFYSLASARLVNPGGKVYAIDVQQDLLSRLKNAAHVQKLSNVEVIHGNVEEPGGTRMQAHFVDAAIVSNLLFQIEHKDEFAAELKRILKKGGNVLVIDWSESFGGMGPAAEHVMTQDKTQELFSKHGFIQVKVIHPGDHHYGFVFKSS